MVARTFNNIESPAGENDLNLGKVAHYQLSYTRVLAREGTYQAWGGLKSFPEQS